MELLSGQPLFQIKDVGFIGGVRGNNLYGTTPYTKEWDMMTVKYRIRCSESDVFVLEKENGFHLTIGSRVNPLSFGNKLAEYGSLGQAVDAAEQFCKMYALSKEYGYHLEKSDLRKDGLTPISVTELLDKKLSSDEMRSLLEKDELLYGTY
jgi:hypothetical protein